MIGLLKIVPIAALATAGATGKNNIMAQLKKIMGATEVAVTQQELNDIAKMIYLDAISDTRIGVDQFAEYCRKNLLIREGVSRDTSVDRWGTPYRLSYSSGGFKVQSAGPDMVLDTADDIVSGYRL